MACPVKNRSFLPKYLLVLSIAVLSIANAYAQELKDRFEIVNRRASLDKKTGALHLNEVDGAGIAWMKGISFENGIIEFDVKGKDTLQRSFVGIAFHGVNDTTYQCIYFRPFNFRSDDAVRKSHSVQYIAMPKYDWPTLRENFPNKYEQAIKQNLDPDEWFHVKITVKGKQFAVYVNGEKQPSLEIQSLADTGGQRLGWWVGNGSGGDWKNLKIRLK